MPNWRRDAAITRRRDARATTPPLLPLPASGARREGWGEGHKSYGGQGRLPGLMASSPWSSPPEEEREDESPAEGSVEVRTTPGTGSALVPCASLVHPLCIWTNNVNAAVATACCPSGFSGTI